MTTHVPVQQLVTAVVLLISIIVLKWVHKHYITELWLLPKFEHYFNSVLCDCAIMYVYSMILLSLLLKVDPTYPELGKKHCLSPTTNTHCSCYVHGLLFCHLVASRVEQAMWSCLTLLWEVRTNTYTLVHMQYTHTLMYSYIKFRARPFKCNCPSRAERMTDHVCCTWDTFEIWCGSLEGLPPVHPHSAASHLCKATPVLTCE